MPEIVLKASCKCAGLAIAPLIMVKREVVKKLQAFMLFLFNQINVKLRCDHTRIATVAQEKSPQLNGWHIGDVRSR